MRAKLEDLETEDGRERLAKDAPKYPAEDLVRIIRAAREIPEAVELAERCYYVLLDVRFENQDSRELNDLIEVAAERLVLYPNEDDLKDFRQLCHSRLMELIRSVEETHRWLEEDFFSHILSRFQDVARSTNVGRIRRGITGRISKRESEKTPYDLEIENKDKERGTRTRRLPHIQHVGFDTDDKLPSEKPEHEGEALSLEDLCDLYVGLEWRQRKVIRLLKKGHPKAGEKGQKRPISELMGTSRPTINTWLNASVDEMLQDERLRDLLASHGFNLAKLDQQSAERQAKREQRREQRRNRNDG